MGIPPKKETKHGDDSHDEDDDDVFDEDNGAGQPHEDGDGNKHHLSLEEYRLILCGWEAFIGFQRWINISSLVVTDNLSDPYLIAFVLHKYFFVICIGIYVFGLSGIESLIPFILLFISFSYLGLIVLDRISPKRAILYTLSMLGCCSIVIGIFVAVLFLLSYVFYDESVTATPGTGSLPPPITNSTNSGNEFDMYSTTQFIGDGGGDTDTDETSTDSTESAAWWITDFFYPMLGIILCSNTVRRLKRGFDNNVPEIKYALWSQMTFVTVILTFTTNSATWSINLVKAVFLFAFVYMGYLCGQQKLHQAVTRLRKIEYATKYLDGSKWVKTQIYWSWLGQLSKKLQL